MDRATRISCIVCAASGGMAESVTEADLQQAGVFRELFVYMEIKSSGREWIGEGCQ